VDGAQSRSYNATEAGELNASPNQQNRFRKNKRFSRSRHLIFKTKDDFESAIRWYQGNCAPPKSPAHPG
jgi:hypothetical protein